jgi:hypothetical protein
MELTMKRYLWLQGVARRLQTRVPIVLLSFLVQTGLQASAPTNPDLLCQNVGKRSCRTEDCGTAVHRAAGSYGGCLQMDGCLIPAVWHMQRRLAVQGTASTSSLSRSPHSHTTHKTSPILPIDYCPNSDFYVGCKMHS